MISSSDFVTGVAAGVCVLFISGVFKFLGRLRLDWKKTRNILIVSTCMLANAVILYGLIKWANQQSEPINRWELIAIILNLAVLAKMPDVMFHWLGGYRKDPYSLLGTYRKVDDNNDQKTEDKTKE